jgi:hypothetical protein
MLQQGGACDSYKLMLVPSRRSVSETVLLIA